MVLIMRCIPTKCLPSSPHSLPFSKGKVSLYITISYNWSNAWQVGQTVEDGVRMCTCGRVAGAVHRCGCRG